MKKSVLVLAAGVAAIVLYSQSPAPPAPVRRPERMSFRLMFGVHDTEPAAWDGSIRLSDGEAAGIEGWLFSGTDTAGKSDWKVSTRFAPPGYREGLANLAHGPMYPNGIVISLAGASASTQANVHTAQGDFSFRVGDAPLGETKLFLNDRIELARVPTTTNLTNSPTDDDFPAAVQTPDGMLVAFIRHTGDTSWSSWTGIQRAPD